MSILTFAKSIFGWVSKRKLCCLQYNRYSDEMSYCLNYHDALNRYILNSPDIKSRLLRIELFENFFNHIKDCSSVACIISAISASEELTDFQQYFNREHQDAESRFSIIPIQKAPLILCGFKHALTAAGSVIGGKK